MRKFPYMDHIIGHDAIKTFLSMMIRGELEPRHVLLSGPPGVGKTSLVSAFVNLTGYKTLELNASDDRSVKVIWRKIEEFAKLSDPRKILILEEVDNMMIPAQHIVSMYLNAAVSNISADHLMVFATCNDVQKVIENLQQLMVSLHVASPGRDSIIAHLLAMYPRATSPLLTRLVEYANGDIRKCKNILEAFYPHTHLIEQIIDSHSHLRRMVIDFHDEYHDIRAWVNDAFNYGYHAEDIIDAFYTYEVDGGGKTETILTLGHYMRECNIVGTGSTEMVVEMLECVKELNNS